MMRAVKLVKTPDPKPAGRNSVRIIGGAWRGRRVSFPDSPGLRPTPDRIRETLFNWLQHSVANARCLDLFAGSGALGLEALSRGAAELVFVEQAVAVARMLREQLARLEASTRGQVAEMGVARFLRTPAAPFDLVFLDPPFGENHLTACGESAAQTRRARLPRVRARARSAGPSAGLGNAQIEVGG